MHPEAEHLHSSSLSLYWPYISCTKLEALFPTRYFRNSSEPGVKQLMKNRIRHLRSRRTLDPAWTPRFQCLHLASSA